MHKKNHDDTDAMKREGLMHVLLVEDNPGDVVLTRQAFKNCGDTIKLHVADDGEEAMNFLYRRGRHANAPMPNFILLDLNLPRKDGREVLAEIKKDPLLRKIPVAILTTSKADEDIAHTYDLHANCFLTKPVSFDAFCAMIKTLDSFWFSSATLPGVQMPVSR